MKLGEVVVELLELLFLQSLMRGHLPRLAKRRAPRGFHLRPELGELVLHVGQVLAPAVDDFADLAVGQVSENAAQAVNERGRAREVTGLGERVRLLEDARLLGVHREQLGAPGAHGLQMLDDFRMQRAFTLRELAQAGTLGLQKR